MLKDYIQTLHMTKVREIRSSADVERYFPLTAVGDQIYSWNNDLLNQLANHLQRTVIKLKEFYKNALLKSEQTYGNIRIAMNPSSAFDVIITIFHPRQMPLRANAAPFIPRAALPEPAPEPEPLPQYENNNNNIPAIAMREVMANIHRNTRRRRRRARKTRRQRRR